MKWLSSIAGKFMMTCEQVNGFILDYLDGRLDTKVHRKFETHMSKCPQCKTYLDQYKTTIALVKGCEEITIPEDVARHTISFLQAELEEFRSK